MSKTKTLKEQIEEIISDISIAGKYSFSPDEAEAINKILVLIGREILKARKQALTEAIELLEKMRYVPHTNLLQTFTVNPIILELKMLRGDYD